MLKFKVCSAHPTGYAYAIYIMGIARVGMAPGYLTLVIICTDIICPVLSYLLASEVSAGRRVVSVSPSSLPRNR